MDGVTISPGDWLQYGALGLLGLGMLFASVIIYKIIIKLLDAQNEARTDMQDVLTQTASALTALTVTVAGLQTVMIGCKHNVANPEETNQI